MHTVAERLAAFTAPLTTGDLPDEVARAGRLHTFDALGCGLAAHAVGVAAGARAAILEPGTTGPSTGIGAAHGLPSGDAVSSNAVSCHALDLDDTHTGSIAHGSVAVVPAALAAVEGADASDADPPAAIVAGTGAGRAGFRALASATAAA